MSSGKELQEMEVGTKQSKTAVNAGAKAADPMPTLQNDGSQLASVEDLGGPTPDNYKPDDDSAKLNTPGGTLKQVKDVVNKGAKPAEAMQGVKEEEEVEGEELTELSKKTLGSYVRKASKDVADRSFDHGASEKRQYEPDADDDKEEKKISNRVKGIGTAAKKMEETEYNAEEEIAEEEEVEVVAEYDIEEDVNALLQGEELSEEFQEKAKTIFETAINAKVAAIRVEMEEQLNAQIAEEQEKIAEEFATVKEQLAERVDAYLEYVADEWFEENALAIDNGLKVEMTDSFLAGMKNLFEEHYVSIPEDKYDVLESMVEKLDDMETKLNEQIEKNVSLNKRLAESVADGILDQVSEGLAETQKEKLASLAESVEFESEAKYREKLEMLKESYFSEKKATSTANKTETLSEGVESGHESYSPSMAAYMRTLGSFSKS